MKASDFAQILRKLIKEEVRSVIREELKSALTPVLLEQKKMKGQAITNRTTANAPMPLPKQKPSKDFGITMNGPLGDILRETANDLRSGKSAPIQEAAGNDWSSMGHFDASDAMNFGHMQEDTDYDMGMSAQFSNDPTAAFIKDYSGVLNSSYEKSGMK